MVDDVMMIINQWMMKTSPICGSCLETNNESEDVKKNQTFPGCRQFSETINYLPHPSLSHTWTFTNILLQIKHIQSLLTFIWLLLLFQVCFHHHQNPMTVKAFNNMIICFFCLRIIAINVFIRHSSSDWW